MILKGKIPAPAVGLDIPPGDWEVTIQVETWEQFLSAPQDQEFWAKDSMEGFGEEWLIQKQELLSVEEN